jgi:hypothetical protein
VTALAECYSGGQPGESASNDHNALRHYFLSLLFIQMRKAICSRRDFETLRRL